ncbi:MAG: AAC(3) family N-acetyltransferase [Anaerolineaceae bacterium]|nr:AAC(3) family N-acetyltransferase [Anaerolineaceae bacterium]
MLSYRDLITGFKKLEIDHNKPVIVHASLSSFGEIRGGADTLLGASLASFSAIMSPTFTYKSMVIPEVGPDNNAIEYGSGYDQNKLAEFYTPEMPADRLMGVLAEGIRLHPHAQRSTHPILSFAGIHLSEALDLQSLEEPLAPIQWLFDHQGYVLLMGVDHTVNTSIHLAEQKAGRKSFIRWALTPGTIYQCAGFPGCSDGFNQATIHFADITQVIKIGDADIMAIPLQAMVGILVPIIQSDPFALLCKKETCPRCQTIRKLQNSQSSGRTNA